MTMHFVRRSRVIVLVQIAVAVSGCSTIPYNQAFPWQYETVSRPISPIYSDLYTATGMAAPKEARRISEDLLATFPDDFALAYYAGYLVCVIDDGGFIARPIGYPQPDSPR